ncbi:MAG: serine/threonine-protein kinase [Planctomycetota bacterium]
MELTQTNLDSTVGRLVVEKGLAAQQDVDRLLESIKQGSSLAGSSGGGPGGGGDLKQKSLANLLVDEGLVTPKQIERLKPELEERRAGAQIPGYQIVRQLGAGAMARVFLAKQVSLDRMVAIKVLPQKFTSNPDFVRRFYDEGKAAAKLNHPHIVQAIDVGHSGEYHYFVMEYVAGRTVFDDITTKGPYAEADAVRIAIETAEALDHSHRRGFIHRDVKPKNIMIEDGGDRAKLADMGLARAVSDAEAAQAEAGKAYGTPYYISPEQIRGEVDVDARADIYSLGATLYHMVTGQVPFDGPNPSSVMHRHLKNALVPPDHLNESLSHGVSEVIEVCMAKDRGKRYRTAADLLEDLRAIQRGEPPLQARKVFDVGALAGLAAGDGDRRVENLPAEESLTAQPAFWMALSGWVVALVMLITLLVVNARL